jgi:predicted Zn finger-like uncharacterized protein
MPAGNMRLSCPNCATEYEVPEAAMAGRSRKLRCAHCGTEWRVPAAELPGADAPVAPRTFGHPVDETARTEILQAVDEEKTHPAAEHGLPLFLSQENGHASAAGAEPVKRNGFADLVHAARNREIEYEPEARRVPAVATSNGPLIVLLVGLLAIALVLLEHRWIIHAWPASARFFKALGVIK